MAVAVLPEGIVPLAVAVLLEGTVPVAVAVLQDVIRFLESGSCPKKWLDLFCSNN